MMIPLYIKNIFLLYMSFQYLFRIIILGHPAVGKSSLLAVLPNRAMSLFHEPTIGIDFASTLTPIIDGPIIKCHLWDTAGQEYFSPIVQGYYRDIAGAIVVYDVSNRESFERLTYWLSELRKVNDDPVRMALVANKTDLHSRRVTKKEGQTFARKHNMDYFEISVKKKDNVALFFYDFVKGIYDTIDPESRILPPGIKKRVPAVQSHNTYHPENEQNPVECCVLL